MEWRIQVAQASRSGVLAALLAEQGVTGATLALEGPAGLYRALGVDTPELDLQVWRLDRVTFKPFPGCAINQGPVFALLGLLDREEINFSDIAGVDVHLSPDQADYPGITNHGPFATPAGAVMSTAFMVSVALRDRALLQRHFMREHADIQINAWGNNVHVVSDSSLPIGASQVILRLHGGRVLHEFCVDEKNFIFDWPQTVRLSVSVASEISRTDGGDRIRRLAEAIEHSGATEVDHIVECCML